MWQAETTKVHNPFRYAGEYFDSETGLIYLRNRYYDPASGRFTQEDPVKDGYNWYAYCNNNPIMFVDPSGLIPTPFEGAGMAEHVYHHNWNDDIDSRRIYNRNGVYTGWRMIDMQVIDGMKIGVYVRGDGLDEKSTYKGEREYALVSKGTSSSGDLDDNLLQPLGNSNDMVNSIDYARWFSDNYKSFEMTFVGHSKGAAEAIANSVATNNNCITFNPAFPNLYAYGLKQQQQEYLSNMKHYIVKGEILNDKFGAPGVGEAVYLPTQVPINSWSLEAWEQRIQNHSMQSVKSALQEAGY